MQSNHDDQRSVDWKAHAALHEKGVLGSTASRLKVRGETQTIGGDNVDTGDHRSENRVVHDDHDDNDYDVDDEMNDTNHDYYHSRPRRNPERR